MEQRFRATEANDDVFVWKFVGFVVSSVSQSKPVKRSFSLTSRTVSLSAVAVREYSCSVMMFGPRSWRGSWVRPSVVCGLRLPSALPARTSRTGASSEAPRCDDGRPLPRVSTVGGRPPPGCEACCAIHCQALQPGFGQCARWRAECERSIQALNTSSPHRWGFPVQTL